MMRIQAAFLAPTPYWLLLAAIGAGPVLLAAATSRAALVPAAIVAIFLQIFVFGRILADLLPDRVATFWGILKTNGARYLMAAVIIGVLSFALSMAFSSVLPGAQPGLPGAVLAKGLVACLTVYAWPLVFLGRSGLAAVLTGIAFLLRDLAASWWIMGIALVGQMSLVWGQVSYVGDRSGPTFAVLVLAGVLHSYLLAVSFAGALHRLLGARVVGGAVDA
jgi:hypothetical protein